MPPDCSNRRLVLATTGISRRVHAVEPDAKAGSSGAELDGVSPRMLRVKRDIQNVARDPFVSVLIGGESGTGKERVARTIHCLSPRASQPFVVVNCGGLPATLADDALFGHVRGAFTGAIGEVAGPFERADGGTVFLDEIGDLTPDLQVKLLRALQQRTVTRLGAATERPFDVRIVAATNADLKVAMTKGAFRDDLYYRLNAYEIVVPPLRARGAADLERTAAALLMEIAARRGRLPLVLSPAVRERFARHSWPGNVRELGNVLERMLVASPPGAIELTPAELPDGFGSSPVASARADAPMPTPADAAAALARHRLNRSRAAMELGVSRHQLYRLLKRAGADACPCRCRA